mgnify:CR=1 FL=1
MESLAQGIIDHSIRKYDWGDYCYSLNDEITNNDADNNDACIGGLHLADTEDHKTASIWIHYKSEIIAEFEISDFKKYTIKNLVVSNEKSFIKVANMITSSNYKT